MDIAVDSWFKTTYSHAQGTSTACTLETDTPGHVFNL